MPFFSGHRTPYRGMAGKTPDMPIPVFIATLAIVIALAGFTIWLVSALAQVVPIGITLLIIFALVLKIAHARWSK